MLNTKQVRAIGNAFCGFGAQYTDRTSKDKAKRANKRRSVVWMFYNSTDANALAAHFAKLGITATRTGTAVNMWTHSGGFEYVRVIANME